MPLNQWSPRAQKAVESAAQRDVPYQIERETMTEQAEATYTEAPASVSIKTFSPSGFDVVVTLRDSNSVELMKRMMTALVWLNDKGFKPTRGNHAPAAVAASKPHSPGGTASGAQGNEADPSWCAIHQEYMQRREKDGDVWYSHKDGENWCTGKTK